MSSSIEIFVDVSFYTDNKIIIKELMLADNARYKRVNSKYIVGFVPLEKKLSYK